MRSLPWVASLVAGCLLAGVTPAAGTPSGDVGLDRTRKADRHGVPLPPGAVARLGRLNDVRPGAGSRGLSFSPDGSLLAFVAQDGDTRVWDVRAEAERHRLPHDPVHFPTRHDRRVFAAGGKLLVGDGGAAWDVATGKPAARFGPAPKVGDRPLAYPTPSPDGKAVLFVTHPGGYEACEVVVFDVATRREVRRFGKGTRVDGPLVFSADGKALATPKHPGPVYRPLGGQQQGQPGAPAAGRTSGVMLWDPATGARMAAWRSKAWTPVGFSGDGKTLYLLGDEKLTARDVVAGKPARAPFGHWVRAAVLLPDRKTLAVAEAQGLALWSLPDAKQAGRVERPVAWCADLAASPSGRWLATGGTDGTVLVWDVAALRAKP